MNNFIHFLVRNKDNAFDLVLVMLTIPLFASVMGYIFNEVAVMNQI